MDKPQPQCKACKLSHSPRMACSVARRLNESGKLPQPTVCLNPTTKIKVDTSGVAATWVHPVVERVFADKAIAAPVTGNAAVSANAQRQAKFKAEKKAAGLRALTVWAKPEHHEAIKAHVARLDSK